MPRNRVGILDYGLSGNIASIEKALRMADAEVHIVKEEKDFILVDKLVLPGVGSFSSVMKSLAEKELVAPLIEQIHQKNHQQIRREGDQ